MGGAEKWVNHLRKVIKKSEDVEVISVHPSLSNLYSRIVLGRTFDQRTNDKNFFITLSSFIPFSNSYKTIRSIIKNSRLIYLKCELAEFFILLYFGGIESLGKSVAGIQSPLFYFSDLGFFSRLHNYIYSSLFFRWLLSKAKRIHVLKSSDAAFIKNKFKINTTVYVPNFFNISSKKVLPVIDNKFHVLFVGELTQRKGVDILIEIIKRQMPGFVFHVVGDGPLSNEVVKLAQDGLCNYYAHLNHDKVCELYAKSDIFFFPSRAESMSLAMLEALSYGLPIVTSKNVALDIPDYMQFVVKDESPATYLTSLLELRKKKSAKTWNSTKTKIKQYTEENFSEKVVLPVLLKKIFEIERYK
jgi:glycosyltransferase involved in cell wall biosynthesis